jgi:hypothetical protein
MQAFRFTLEKALEIRARQLSLAELEFQRAAAALAHTDREREILLSARLSAESQIRRASALAGEDLLALEWFHRRSQKEERRLLHLRAEREQIVEERRAAMLEARRRLRLLERLRERRYSEWSARTAKEIEDLASESHLATWRREAR